MDDLNSLSIPEIKEKMTKVLQGMEKIRTDYELLNSEANELLNLLNKKREEFLDVKVEDVIEFERSFRIGKYGFLSDKNVKLKITKVTDKFIKGDLLVGDLIIFKGKSNDKYDYIYRKNFSVNKMGFIEMMSIYTTQGKALDRDSEIDNILNQII